ncbi:hypothetical protein [Streptomyces bauhiniae]
MRHDPDSCLLVPHDMDVDLEGVRALASVTFTGAAPATPFARAARWLERNARFDVTVLDTASVDFPGEEEPYGLRLHLSFGDDEREDDGDAEAQ